MQTRGYLYGKQQLEERSKRGKRASGKMMHVQSEERMKEEGTLKKKRKHALIDSSFLYVIEEKKKREWLLQEREEKKVRFHDVLAVVYMHKPCT